MHFECRSVLSMALLRFQYTKVPPLRAGLRTEKRDVQESLSQWNHRFLME
jgi:hypothetical protein